MAAANAKISSFRDLDVWQLGMEIVLDVYRLAGSFPPQEAYGLCSQIKRAVVSIPSNIAEGFRRSHGREYRQFLHVALGSCAEVETQSEIAASLGYASRQAVDALLEKLDHESRMLRNLIKKLGSAHDARQDANEE